MQVIRNFAFGPFAALAFVSALFVFWKKGKEEHIDEFSLMDIALLAGFWGWVGARLGFVLTHLDSFGWDPLRWISLVEYPGYLGVSGIVAAVLALISEARKAKEDVWKVLDLAAVAVSFALTILSLGMFVHGAGFGNATNLPIGLPFPGVFDRRHPVQLYAMVGYLLVFMLLWVVEKRYRLFSWYKGNRRIAQPGLVTSFFLAGYAVLEFGLSFLRESQLKIANLPVEQGLYVVFFVGAIVIFFDRWGKLPALKR